VGLALGAYLFLGREAGLGLRLWGFLATGTLFALTAGSGRWFPWMLYAVALGLGLYALCADLPVGNPTEFVWNAVLSSLLLGFSMAAMLLGHWYLVEPRLRIEELKRLSLVLIALIIIRFCFGTYFAFSLVSGKSEMEVYRFLLSGTPGIFILMRWVWGLLGPLILSYLIWGTVRIRSTQSATGILYVAVLFVLTGEILSQYLALFHGMPF
jgi:hypothetical protein